MAEETNQLRVRLVTPERTLFDHAATAVELPSKSGYMEVLYGHAPLVAELGAGDVIVHGGPVSEAGGAEGVSRYNVSWGFAEVLGDRVTILAADALKPEEIDVPRAQEQLARGNKEWDAAGDSEAAYTESLRVISEAEAKIASATEKH
jgi:F-type H+-transporting ATPase subunit epsilon